MFTGLIECTGSLISTQAVAQGQRFVLSTPANFMEDVSLGDSIAINGVCTTVVAFTSDSFTVELSPETLDKTTLGQLTTGQAVNLEKPLLPTSRLGGHFVTGHVDGTATLTELTHQGDYWALTFALGQPELAPYLVDKGSVAVDGISLTVNWVSESRFGVMIIPHTQLMTTLSSAHVGQTVNIETDILGKYVNRLLGSVLNPSERPHVSAPITAQLLAEHGFVSTRHPQP